MRALFEIALGWLSGLPDIIVVLKTWYKYDYRKQKASKAELLKMFEHARKQSAFSPFMGWWLRFFKRNIEARTGKPMRGLYGWGLE